MTIINTETKVPTVPETLGVSNVVQENDGRLSEESISREYSGETSALGHRHLVTLNAETQLVHPTAPSPANDVNQNLPCKPPTKKKKRHAAYYRRMEQTLTHVNEEWNLKNHQDKVKTTYLPTISISFNFVPPHQSSGIAAPVAYSRESRYTTNGIRINHESIEYGRRWELLFDGIENSNISKDQLKQFTLAELKYTRNHGLTDCTPNKVELICEHAGWPQDLIVEVSSCWKEYYQSSLEPRKRKFDDSSGEPDGKRRRLNEPQPMNRLTKKKPWRQPPRCWTRNVQRTAVPEERSGVSAAIAEFRRLQHVPEEAMSHDTDADESNDTEDLIFHFADDDDYDEEIPATDYQPPDDATFESLLAESESMNIAGGGPSKFSAAARLLLLHQNSLCPRTICPPEPTVLKSKPADIDDTRPLGHEWHLDDKDRRVRRSLRIIYMKERTEARGN